MLMETYDFRAAALVILLLDLPSVYLYSTRVMGFTHANSLIPSFAQVVMLLVLQVVGSVVRTRTQASRQLAVDAARARGGARMLQDSANSHPAGLASTSMSTEESGKENKKTM